MGATTWSRSRLLTDVRNMSRTLALINGENNSHRVGSDYNQTIWNQRDEESE